MPTWIVTGGSGFLGHHLLSVLAEGKPIGAEVYCVGRRCPSGWPSSAFRAVDLEELGPIGSLVAELRPEVVFHLAGQIPPAPSDRFFQANVRGTVHLLNALGRLKHPVRLVVAGSAAELGEVPIEALPVKEDHVCRPTGPYALSKWLASSAALTRKAPLEVVVARIFNPIGPKQPSSQAFGQFTSRLLCPEPDPLRLVVGDLSARRDFIDARDIASALVALACSGRPGRIYHVGTGRSQRVEDGLNRLIELSGRQVEIAVDPEGLLYRGPSDSRADIGRIMRHTEWVPRIAFEQSLTDLWNEACPAASMGQRRVDPPQQAVSVWGRLGSKHATPAPGSSETKGSSATGDR